jgi:hypothetical protein
LREILGKHVKQAGSLVAPNHLRFDFSHFTAVEDEELQDIEDLINKEVLRNIKVETLTDVPIDEAINKYHAMALFGEKYGDRVRVVKIGDFSTELCGGTHTAATGEIGLIKILKEGSVSSGVRRVEAVTGEGSLQHFRMDHQLEGVVSSFASPHHGSDSLSEMLKSEFEKKDAEIKRLTRELDQVRMKSASSSVAAVGHQSAGASGGQFGAGADADVGGSTAGQSWVGRGGAGVGDGWECGADCGSHKGFDVADSGGESDWAGGAEGWREGWRASGFGGGGREGCRGAGCGAGRGLRGGGGAAGVGRRELGMFLSPLRG